MTSAVPAVRNPARLVPAVVPDTVARVTADPRVRRTRTAMLAVGRAASRARRLFTVWCAVATGAAVVWLAGLFLLFGGGWVAVGPVVMLLPTAVVPPALLWGYRFLLGRAAEVPTHIGDLGRLARENLDALGVTTPQDLGAITHAARGGAWTNLVRIARRAGGLRGAYPVLGVIVNPIVLLVVGICLAAAAFVTLTAVPLFGVGAVSWLLLW